MSEPTEVFGLPAKEVVLRSELVVMETVVHRVQGSIQSAETRSSRPLTSDEQTFQRRVIVEGTIGLDWGWVQKCALLHVKNVTGINERTLPDGKVKGDPVLLLLNGIQVGEMFGNESIRISRPITTPGYWKLMSPKGRVTVILTIVPE